MSQTVDESLDSLKVAIDEACVKMDALRAENKLLRQVLYDLYEASPTSCDSDTLNQAQIAAEKVLGVSRV